MNKFALRYDTWSVYVDNAIFLGTASVDVGDLSHDTVEISGSGIAGTVAVPAAGQVPSMQITLHHHAANKDTLSLLAQGQHTLELRPVLSAFDKARAAAGHIYQSLFASVYNTSLSFGSIAPNSDPGATSTHEIIYFRVDEDGQTVYELDKFNFIERVLVNGQLVDQLAEIRNHL